MEDQEKAKLEKFTFINALDAASEWTFRNTRVTWFFLICILLIIAQAAGCFGTDTDVTGLLWIFPFSIGFLLIVALIFYLKYRFKVVVESEVEAKEYKERLFKGKRWNSSGVRGVILEMRWVEKK